MKKLLLLLVTFIAGITAYGQDEGKIKLTLNVDNPERVSIAIFGEPLEGLKEGDNELEVDPWTNIEISAAKGCTLKSVVNSAGESIAISSNTATILLTDEKTEETLTITSEKEGEVAFTIEVDKPSEVSVLDCNYKSISLSEGVNEMSMPQSELPLIIGSVNYGQDLYSVTLDGVEQTFNYGYSVMPKDGSKIVIIAEFPEKDCTLTFEQAEDIGRFFTDIQVNGQSAGDFSNELTVRCGDNVSLYYNPACWEDEQSGTPLTVTIDGKTPAWFGPGYSFVVKHDTKIIVEQAVRKPEITVNVNIDNPDNVIVYRVSESYYDVLELEAGANTVTVPADEPSMAIMAVSDECSIEGVTVNGRPRTVEYSNYFSLTGLEEGDEVGIFTAGTTSVDKVTTTDEISGNVYTISGTLIISNATPADIARLPKGIYICNGKKLMIR